MRVRSILAAMIVTTTVVQAFESENLLKNGGFEQEFMYWASTGTATCIVRKDWHAQISRWSFGVGNDEGKANAYGRIWQDVELSDALTFGRSCTFSLFTMAEDNYSGYLVMTLEFRRSDGKMIDRAERIIKPHKRNWKRKKNWKQNELKAIAPPTTQTIRVICASERMPTGEGLTCIWLDNASFILQ